MVTARCVVRWLLQVFCLLLFVEYVMVSYVEKILAVIDLLVFLHLDGYSTLCRDVTVTGDLLSIVCGICSGVIC
ncbi:hypothetical protein GWI33_005144 [Rhynchophorus ferrugineus]|uniref:Uncharacterized protein n=1 Tax=Rhynchophorus ferrugineus TaxID=354439 RepID=A0A834MG95_RHYFE|nr:hypothetical protein GWI33_005144 [Rhynchophorus ferrugineus]